MTKVDIISGFLGAGKTTFIKQLIEQVFTGEKLVLIENEFGEIGIDGGFLKDAGIEITEMNSGCICCTLVGDFSKALQKVLEEYKPDRVLIEPSGVGKLSDIVKAIEDVKKDAEIEISGRITVVDGKKAVLYLKNFGEFFEDQVKHASTIVISRTQMMSDEKIEECVHMLRRENEKAAIISTPWDELGAEAICRALERGAEIEELLESKRIVEYARQLPQLREALEALVNAGEKAGLREFFQNPDFQRFAHLREYEDIVDIDWMEEKNHSGQRFWTPGMSASRLVLKLRALKYALKRIEYGADEGEDAWIREHYSLYAVVRACIQYTTYKDKILQKLGIVL